MPDTSPKVDKVLFITPEVTPLAKTGGLGDVAGGLPPALVYALGLDIRLVMPLYGHIDREIHNLSYSGLELAVPVAGEMKPCRVWQGQVDGCPVYLLGNEQYFSRPGLYGDVYGDFGDNLERFVFLCRGAVELARALDWPAQVVHAHDWQTALLPAYLATHPFDLGPLESAAGIITIHNLAFQGIYPRHDFHLTGLPHYMDNVEGAEYWGNISLLKAGLMTAKAITTVSPTYAHEIQTPELGMGMEGVLRRRSQDLHGIINGVDYSQWSPETDPLLPATYSAVDLSGKAQCRRALLEAFGLEATQPGGLLMGFIGRLTPQKGVSLIAEAGEALLEQGANLALLGTGDADQEAALSRLAARHPGRVGLKLTFSEHLAHLLQGGSDLILMPSFFEPLRPEPDVRPALRHPAAGARHRRAQGHGDSLWPSRRPGHGLCFQSVRPRGVSGKGERGGPGVCPARGLATVDVERHGPGFLLDRQRAALFGALPGNRPKAGTRRLKLSRRMRAGSAATAGRLTAPV